MAGLSEVGSAALPALRFIGNSELDALSGVGAEQKPEPPAYLTQLAGYIAKCFQEAELHKTRFITPRLLDCQRRRKGEYSPEILEEIKRISPNASYHNMTKTKCKAGEAWLLDVMAPTGDKPWTLDPTPIPDLPDDVKTGIQEAAVLEYNMSHSPLGPGESPAVVDFADLRDIAMKLYDEAMKQLKEQAEERARRMERVIEDQLAEGRFMRVLHDFVYHLFTYPCAFVKGPVIKRRKQMAWRDGKIVVEEREYLSFSAPSPHDMFPAPNARDVNEGYLIEVLAFDVTELMPMREVEGWNADAIDRVLEDSGGHSGQTHTAFISGEAERAQMESRDTTTNSGLSPTGLRALDFWGPVQVKILREWGMPIPEDVSDVDYREIHAIMVGRHVVYAVENPDPIGRRPYSKSSFERVPNSFWGEGLPENMADCQDAYNACWRNLVDNLAFCSGPMAAGDVDAMPEGEDWTQVYPRRFFFYNGLRAANSTRKVIEFFQPDANASTLLAVADASEQKADDRVLIPRYTHGNDETSGAGETASGLSMLMTAASKGMKRVVAHVDEDVIRDLITRIYSWNMQYHPDESIKGDLHVVPRGVLATLIKEQTQLRRQEFLNNTNNPADLEIIGLQGRAQILRGIAQGLDLPVDKIVPTDEELLERQRASMQQQMMEPEPEPEPEAA